MAETANQTKRSKLGFKKASPKDAFSLASDAHTVVLRADISMCRVNVVNVVSGVIVCDSVCVCVCFFFIFIRHLLGHSA